MNIFDASTCCRYIECLLIIYGYFSQCAYALSGHVCSCHVGEWELSKRIFDAVKFSRRRFFWGEWWHHILLHKMVACAGKLSSVLRLLLVIPDHHCFPDIKILIPGSMTQSFPCVCCYASVQFRTIASSGMENSGEWGSKKWLTWMSYVKGPEIRHNQYGCHSGCKTQSLSGGKRQHGSWRTGCSG